MCHISDQKFILSASYYQTFNSHETAIFHNMSTVSNLWNGKKYLSISCNSTSWFYARRKKISKQFNDNSLHKWYTFTFGHIHEQFVHLQLYNKINKLLKFLIHKKKKIHFKSLKEIWVNQENCHVTKAWNDLSHHKTFYFHYVCFQHILMLRQERRS